VPVQRTDPLLEKIIMSLRRLIGTWVKRGSVSLLGVLYLALTINALTCVLAIGPAQAAESCTMFGVDHAQHHELAPPRSAAPKLGEALDHGEVPAHSMGHNPAMPMAGSHLSLCACLDNLASTDVPQNIDSGSLLPRQAAHLSIPLSAPVSGGPGTPSAPTRGPPGHHLA
jgi:hypothetical protein